MDSLDGQRLIVVAREEGEGGIGGVVDDGAKGLWAVAVGQVQVQQNQRGRFIGHRGEAIRQPVNTIHFDRGLAFDQAKTNQVCISRVVFNQQYTGSLVVHYSPCTGVGLPNRAGTVQSLSLAEKRLRLSEFRCSSARPLATALYPGVPGRYSRTS